MDHFEQTVRRRDEQAYNKDKFRYHLLLAVALAAGLLTVVDLSVCIAALAAGRFSLFTLFPTVILALIAILAFYFKDEMLLEYDYLVEDDTLIIAKIRNLKSRKEVVTVRLSALKRMETYTPERFQAIESKKYNFSLNEDVPKQLLFFEKDGQMAVMLLEANDTLTTQLKKELAK